MAAHAGALSAPVVSVITTFLDGEPYLAEAIASVRAQTYPHWELLLVDDGSSDGSPALARAAAAADPARIRYLAHPGHANRGMSASRNLGIAHARGAYVAFLDADDVYLPRKLEDQVALLAAHPSAAMVYGATLHWFGWTGRPEDRAKDTPRRLGVAPETLVPPPTLLPKFLRLEAQTPGMGALLVRREVIEAVGGFEEAFRGMYDDQVFIYKICLERPVYVAGGQWDLYRQHPASHSQRYRAAVSRHTRGAPNAAYERFLRWLEGYLHERGSADAATWAALERELRPYRSPFWGWVERTRAHARWLRSYARHKLAGRLRR